MKEISRRELLKGAVALTAGLALTRDRTALGAQMGGGGMGGGGGGMGGGGGGMDGGTIDPPLGGVLRQPVEIGARSPGLVEVDVTAMRAPVEVNGRLANLMTYNGDFPGGTIRARKGDLVRINFHNGLPADGAVNFLGHPMYVTNLHGHGLHVTPGDNPDEAPFTTGSHGDNMLVMLHPGEGALYEYDLSKQYPGTLNFYHPHIHGSVTDQMWAGMAGCLLVEDEVTALSGYETRIMMLKDITLAGSEPAPHTSVMQYMHGVEGDTVLMNGQVNPKVSIQPGEVQRWRILNACTARFFRLSLTGHAMYVVGTEAGLLDKPYPVTEVLLSPGERVEILVKADRSASSYKFLSLPYSRTGNMGGQQVTLATMVYGGKKVRQALPSVVDPAAARVSMDPSSLRRHSLTLSMGQGAGYINGRTYVNHDNCYELESDLGTWEVWEVINDSGMDHPFHHHVNAAQVLSITGGDANYRKLYTTTPSWKDVTIVPKWGRIELLMPVMDYAGMTMMHCHIIEHEDIGMMGMWCIEEGMHHDM